MKRFLKDMWVSLVIAALLIAVWAFMAFMGQHLGITLSLPPMGYFDSGDGGCSNRDPPERAEVRIAYSSP